MAVKVPPKDLPLLLPALKKQLPMSLCVYTPISLITRGLTGYDVYVDRLPEVSSVVVITNEEGLNDHDHEKTTCIYTSEDTEDVVLRDLLGKSGLLNQPVIVAPFVSLKTNRIIKDISCTEGSFVEHLSITVPLFCCTAVGQLPELPKGYSARCLRHEDFETILTGVWYKDFDYVKSVKRVLALGALSVGVEDSSGKLVAWTLQHMSGMLGMTFVIPEHRNKKLGKYVTVALTQKMIAQDGFCLAGIEEENSVSVALHEGVGFIKMDQPFVTSVYYKKGCDAGIEHIKIPSSENKMWK
ncbi:uncharacterized protein LOC117336741 [Pecten maximus]|uniref:uncharacterized protein LOC117336741 n=1 Tax=Pecten maximus TaxID=6579 RepID=UPI001458F064|nr:uncharacterized protein LOC117336741 [Pecten maximus]